MTDQKKDTPTKKQITVPCEPKSICEDVPKHLDRKVRAMFKKMLSEIKTKKDNN